jgi:hypothetical protein
MLRKRITGLVVGFTLLLTGNAVAAVATLPTGHWKAGSGGFTVSKDGKSLSGLHLSGKECQLGNIAVLGSQRLHLAATDGVSNWIVGTNDPSRKSPRDRSGIVPDYVAVRAGSKVIHGAQLDLVFGIGGFARDNGGDLIVRGCDLSFFASP